MVASRYDLGPGRLVVWMSPVASDLAGAAKTAAETHVSDVVRRDLVPLLRRKVEDDIQFSYEGNAQLHVYHRGVLDNFATVMDAFEHDGPEAARQVIASRGAMIDIEHRYEMIHFGEITQAQEGSRAVNHLYLDLADYLQRINSYAESIAYTMLEGYLDSRGGERKKGGPLPLETSIDHSNNW